MSSGGPRAEFDGHALHAALDAHRAERGLSWPGVAREMWDLSRDLNAIRDDHPISPATLTNLARQGGTTCQHALFMLRWLDRVPEDFMAGQLTVAGTPLPAAGPGQRLRWHLHARPHRPRAGLFEAMDAARRIQHLTWAELARLLHTTPNQLSGLRHARFAIGMRPAMNITQWLRQPAANFVYAARW